MAAFCLGTGSLATAQEDNALYVFAATSLSDAMKEVAEDFEKESGIKVYLNFAGSNTLRVQIEQGAPWDIFISANEGNVFSLINKGLVAPDDKEDLLHNSLVVITRQENPIELSGLQEIPGNITDYLSLAEPSTVPAGIYAKEALTKAGIWKTVKGKVSPALDVRSAIVHVQKGEASIGIVYKTEAVLFPDIRIVYEILEEFHTAIIYPVCIAKESSERNSAQAFVQFLQKADNKNIFRKYGFRPL